jgi:hypothetical protein
MTTPVDMIAAMDQAVEAAKETARPIVAFWHTLEQGGVEPEAAKQLTLIYAQTLLQKPPLTAS